MLKKLLALWFTASLFTSSAWANIDVLMVFTPSGVREASQATGAVDPGPVLIESVNDTFEGSVSTRPFVILDSYYIPYDLWSWKSVEILREAESDKQEWAKEGRYRREMLGADIVIVVWGDDDTLDRRDSGGWATKRSAYLAVRGKHSYGRKTMEHELGHILNLSDSDHPGSVMSTTGDYYARTGYTTSEARMITRMIMVVSKYRSRKENTCIQ